MNDAGSAFDARRRRARVGLAALAATTVFCLGVALSPRSDAPFVPPPSATSDLNLYHLIVARVRAGESYYNAAATELRAHGYPTRSVFNWRLPLYAWFFGSLPTQACGRAILIVAMLVTTAWTCRGLLDDCGFGPAFLGGVMFVGATFWCFGEETFLFTELWAGLLMAFSLAAFRAGRGGLGVTAGMLALCFRELALPYALVCLALALRAGRRGEAIAWTIGLAAFLLGLGLHSHEVLSRITDADQAIPGGWVRFGGVRFVLMTSQANVFLMVLPLWCTAFYLPLVVLGILNRSGEAGERLALTVGAYLAAFGVVGAPFNFYWGFLTAPFLALGFATGPRELIALVRDARSSSPTIRPTRSDDAPKLVEVETALSNRAAFAQASGVE